MVNERTPKFEAQVMHAIRRLQTVKGSTQREISNYISQEYDLPLQDVRRQVQLALKRGVTYGILQRMKGGCFTYNQQLFDGHSLETEVEIPCKGRRRRRKSRRSRRRRKSRKRQRGKTRSKKAEEIVKEIDGTDLKMLTKQAKRSSTLLRRDVPESEASSTTWKSDEIRE
ncbi:uncharacterized protein LOC114880659 [Osmia bicornis bicornis]|uniref:uncharacterized protein LOC114880659 n=1 Tax=Osmia bicornis bicornis TaxID=1437191 RepID=UPI0010F524B1|nr:uncharacterized protein LOC114880659 [Osmia bicornis bicornis]